MNDESLSVSEINGLIKEVLSAGFPRSLWVCGEIQNYRVSRTSPHLFFDLVEKDEGARDVKAKVGVAIWGGVRSKIEAVLRKAENSFELKDGIEVRFLVKVDFYPGYGTLRLIVDNIDPVYTLGKIAQERQKLIAELTKSGVLQKNKQLEFSPVPLSIGLITAYDTAAYNDFIDELKRSGYAFKVYLANASMQGKNCEPAVCSALVTLNKREDLDAIVITRGGGSIAELSCFDSRAIALAVAASRYPILTGIGHEINTSITDLAAHTFAKTPTAIAQLLAERVRGFIDLLNEHGNRMGELSRERLKQERESHVLLTEKLATLPERFMARKKEALKPLALRLQNHTQSFLKVHDRYLAERSEVLRLTSSRRMAFASRALEQAEITLKKTIPLRLERAHTKISACEKLVEMASPKNILKRGFSLTRNGQGKTVRSSRDVNPGEVVTTELAEGVIHSEVLPKEPARA